MYEKKPGGGVHEIYRHGLHTIITFVQSGITSLLTSDNLTLLRPLNPNI